MGATTTTTMTTTAPAPSGDDNQLKTARDGGGGRSGADDDDVPPPPQPFHPLGPPAYLSVLPVGGTMRCRLRSPPSSCPSSPDDDDVDDGTGRGGVITRLSRRPDVFLIWDVLSSADASTLMDSAA
jgi:hypothetical protein